MINLFVGGDGEVDKTHLFGVGDLALISAATHSPMRPSLSKTLNP